MVSPTRTHCYCLLLFAVFSACLLRVLSLVSFTLTLYELVTTELSGMCHEPVNQKCHLFANSSSSRNLLIVLQEYSEKNMRRDYY